MYDQYEPLEQILFCLNVNNSLELDRTDDKTCYAFYHLKWYSLVAKLDINHIIITIWIGFACVIPLGKNR